MAVSTRTLGTAVREATLSFLHKSKDWTAANVAMLVVFALTLFLSATLLMSVQPLIGKLITPLLGGTPAVWNTCMVFFEALLLAGYAYAHFSTQWLGVRKQAVVHLVILALPFLFFPIAVNKDYIQGELDNPIPRLLLLLATSVGVPFFVVSTSAPLLQKWFSTTANPSAKDPYFLYGASNLGSMIGLLSYPTIIEPTLRLSTQTWSWAAIYAVLVLLIAGCAAFMWFSPPAKPEEEPDPAAAKQAETQAALALTATPAARSDGIQQASAKVGVSRDRSKKNKRGRDRAGQRPNPDANEQALPVELAANVTWLRRLRWVLLAAVPCSLMLGATTYMTTDIAAIPFLWVLPLAIYLLSFIIVFAKIPPVVQSVLVFLFIEAGCVFVGTMGLAYTNLDDSIILALRIMIVAGGIAAFWILTFRMHNLIHICCVGTLPLIVLLLIFMMLSEIKPPKIAMTIGIHLVTLFIVSMVCHGELARNRPPTKYLTEYFLWISFGGVVGGMFNALLAPIIFNAIVEYELAMVVACLLVPPLGMNIDARFGVQLDLGLTALCLTIGSVLIGCRLWENDLAFGHLTQVPGALFFWLVVGVLLLFGVGLFAALRYRDDQPRRLLRDLFVPLSLVFGVIALNVLGLVGVFLYANGMEKGSQPAPAMLRWSVLAVLVLVWLGVKGSIIYYRYVAERKVPVPLIGAAVAINLIAFLEVALLYGAAPKLDGSMVAILTLLMLASVSLNVGVVYLLYRWCTRFERLQVVLDMTLPFAVLLLAVGLIVGLQSQVMLIKLAQLSQILGQLPSQVRVIFTFGIPAVLCYTFAERSIRFGLSVGAVVLAAALVGLFDESIIYQERSFFGVLRVESDGISHRLVHGTTLHGRQYTTTNDGSDAWPITYYHPTGPVGHLCTAYNMPPEGNTAVALAVGMPGKMLVPPRPIGVIGLGTGTMACWTQSGQNLTFYDIDPVVRKITYSSTKYFTFVQQARDRGVHVNLIMGDARLTMERNKLKEEEKYHILVVDAFSSDAIPIHLMTYEAMVMYFEHMSEDGILCFHISNRYLNLKPVLGNLAAKYTRERNQPVVGYYMEDGEDAIGKTASTWVVLARDPKYLRKLSLYDEWDARMGLESEEDTVEYRVQRFQAMQKLCSAAQQLLLDNSALSWDDVRPDLKWDKVRPTLRSCGVQAAAREPVWIPLPVDPSKGEWTDDYSALFRVFRW